MYVYRTSPRHRRRIFRSENYEIPRILLACIPGRPVIYTCYMGTEVVAANTAQQRSGAGAPLGLRSPNRAPSPTPSASDRHTSRAWAGERKGDGDAGSNSTENWHLCRTHGLLCELRKRSARSSHVRCAEGNPGFPRRSRRKGTFLLPGNEARDNRGIDCVRQARTLEQNTTSTRQSSKVAA